MAKLFSTIKEKRIQILKGLSVIATLYLVLTLILGMYWSQMPDVFDVKAISEEKAKLNDHNQVIGYTSVVTEIELMSILLNKAGGFVSNDRFPPGIWIDNIRNFEYGALIQIRDFSRELRKDFSRSQTQSIEDYDLSRAEPHFNFNHNSWIFPSSESEYRQGLKHLESYLQRLQSGQNDAHFYARADNLSIWLSDVSTRLGSVSQRLSASVGQAQLNIDISNEQNLSILESENTANINIPEANQPNNTENNESSSIADAETDPQQAIIRKTPWMQIDDVFYEARGQAFALLHLLKAVEYDFHDILDKKNALPSLQQVIRELEATQQAVYSPMIMNGSGFGLFANHSLVMANYISRANASVIELQQLLNQG